MARIPFELNDEIKDAFVERIMLYGENSVYAQRPSMSQVLRSIVSLIVTMKDSELRNFLELAGKSEQVVSEYVELFHEYKGKSLVPAEFPLINTEFDKVYELLCMVKLGKISENKFKEEMELLNFSLSKTNMFLKEREQTLNIIHGNYENGVRGMKLKTVAQSVMEEDIKNHIGE